MVQLRVNANLKGLTLEGLISRRKAKPPPISLLRGGFLTSPWGLQELHLAMLKNCRCCTIAAVLL